MEPSPRPIDVIHTFVQLINAHDVDAILGLLTTDHHFIDSAGADLSGRDALRAGWIGYFQWFPDYVITVDTLIAEAEVVAVFGTAAGTFALGAGDPSTRAWCLPAAWKAVVRDGAIAVWQVYADNSMVRDIMQQTSTE